jgi:predicted lipid-binding transport protein (Tim44 family)
VIGDGIDIGGGKRFGVLDPTKKEDRRTYQKAQAAVGREATAAREAVRNEMKGAAKFGGQLAGSAIGGAVGGVADGLGVGLGVKAFLLPALVLGAIAVVVVIAVKRRPQ